MIKIESKFEAISNVEVIEHRRLVTPWFFVRLKSNSYKKLETKCFFFTVPCVFRGWERNNSHLVFEFDEGDLVEKLNFSIEKLLENK